MPQNQICWIAGIALLFTGWYLPRRAAGTRWQWSAALPMDLLLPLIFFGMALAFSARPLFAGVVTLAAGAGWARADRDKRRVLAEPIVFTDVFQAFDIFRHPRLAMPFPHKGPVVLAALITLAFFALVLWREPAAWHGWYGLPFLAVVALALTMLAARWVVPVAYRTWRARELTADVARDGARHGPLATLLFYGLFAHSERAQRREALQVTPVQMSPVQPGPIVLVQNESFFDARRLHPAIPANLLPHFDRACRDGMQWGQFAVPSWGANTVRTEFAALTGIGEQALGFDRFNPYYRFADATQNSLAQRLRAAGYRTICLHPFDRSFYRRDQVMPRLGFDEFLGEEQFPNAMRINGYISDLDVAEVAARIIREHGPKLFLFVITIENHGPWFGAPDRQIGDLAGLPLNVGERLGLNHYLASLVHADAMLGQLRATLEALPTPAVLGFYGDHLPSFPSIYPKLGLKDSHSDYLIWRSQGGRAERRDLPAQDLAAALLAACDFE